MRRRLSWVNHDVSLAEQRRGAELVGWVMLILLCSQPPPVSGQIYETGSDWIHKDQTSQRCLSWPIFKQGKCGLCIKIEVIFIFQLEQVVVCYVNEKACVILTSQSHHSRWKVQLVHMLNSVLSPGPRRNPLSKNATYVPFTWINRMRLCHRQLYRSLGKTGAKTFFCTIYSKCKIQLVILVHDTSHVMTLSQWHRMWQFSTLRNQDHR